MRADRSEIARYLGYGSVSPDPAVEARITYCLGELADLTPRYVSRFMPLDRLSFQSTDLDRHLAGCPDVILFAATLGAGADTLLRRWTASDMSLAVIGQACAAALLEGYCDECMAKLSSSLPQGRYLRARYSPGYGDFSLDHQRSLLDLLDASRRLGLSLTEGGMRCPPNRFTGGHRVTDDRDSCHIHKCARCAKTDCPFRKEQKE
jgi:hypothetical protein